ncbi:MAG: M48 family metallopeptidase [Marinoscillum sp.]
MKSIRIVGLVGIVITLSLTMSCDKNGDVVLFSIKNDIELGAQVSEQIEADTSFTILSPVEYPEAYSYLQGITDEILSAEEVTYKEEFAWKIHIIHDDVLNAFATPGGYIYVYTGLINYLDNVDDLAGVMGHEIAHSDQRHSSKQLQRQYGIQVLLSIALGKDASQLAEVVGQIAGTGAILAFSRSAESEADEYSVKYLADTKYACNGAYSFFQKLIDEKATGNTPEFLSTHPDPEDRVDDINAKAAELGCDTTPVEETGFTYTDFKNSLPQQ